MAFDPVALVRASILTGCFLLRSVPNLLSENPKQPLQILHSGQRMCDGRCAFTVSHSALLRVVEMSPVTGSLRKCLGSGFTIVPTIEYTENNLLINVSPME